MKQWQCSQGCGYVDVSFKFCPNCNSSYQFCGGYACSSWKCLSSVCEFHNPPEAVNCIVCGLANPKGSSFNNLTAAVKNHRNPVEMREGGLFLFVVIMIGLVENVVLFVFQGFCLYSLKPRIVF